MKSLGTIFRRETAAYFDSPIAYIFAVVFLGLSCGLFMNDFFLVARVEMKGYFERLPFFLLVFAPTLSMRLWAEDKKHNTFELLMTLPVRESDVVLGKYFSALFVFALVLAGSLPIVVMLYALGAPDGGLIVSSYMGAVLLGAFLLSLGVFISGLARDQIVAYLLTLLAAALFLLTGHDTFVGVMDGLWPALQVGSRLRDNLSALPHYENFTSGVVELSGLVYFLGLSACFLALNRLALAQERR